MARYTDYDRDYDRRYRSRDARYGDRPTGRLREDDLEGYEREDGRVRWDYAGRGPAGNDRDYRGRYDRGEVRDRDVRDRDYGDRDYRDRYDNDDRADRERYLQDRYDRDYNREYVRDFGDHNGFVGRYEGDGLGRSYTRDYDRDANFARDYARGRAGGPMAGKGPEGYTRSSDRIVEQVNERLTDDGRVDATRISVSADGGEVTLAGTVESRMQKRRAEDVAESVRGVRDVHNRLTVDRDGTTETKKTSARKKAASS